MIYLTDIMIMTAPFSKFGLHRATDMRFTCDCDKHRFIHLGLTRVDPPAMWNLGASVPQAVPEHKSERYRVFEFVCQLLIFL